MQNIPLTEARARLGELVDQVRYGGEVVGITKGGKPVAAVVPYSYAARIQRRRARILELVDRIQAGVAEAGLTEEAIAALVSEAIEEVRNDADRPTAAAVDPTTEGNAS